jgi:hypothetical protein
MCVQKNELYKILQHYNMFDIKELTEDQPWLIFLKFDLENCTNCCAFWDVTHKILTW